MTRDEMDEIKRHFDVVADGLGTRIGVIAGGHQLLAEGQAKIAERLEGVEQRLGGVEQRIDRLESEIKAMLRLSFVELERRVLDLEAIVVKLVKRVDRLETGSSQ
ncbi:MAG: hypothetical protein LAO05_18230 [Acidobacteriia bacterium]|nr:hypothetical protein [Terriglobia bacterium]